MDPDISRHIAALANDVQRLEQLVGNLYEHLGIATPAAEPAGDELPAQVRALVDSGDTMRAVMLYRELTRLALPEAKAAIEAYAKGR
jgi:ribosomal protein L7/L12